MRTSYPWQIDSIIHKSKDTVKTFGMEAKLFSPKEENELRTPAAPLEMHEGYSVFKGTLIEKNDKKTRFVTFNIPAKSVPYIHKKTVLAMDTNYKAGFFTNLFNKVISLQNKVISALPGTEKNKDVDIESTKAFTTKFISGTLKGKSPIEVLMESPSNKTTLLNQRKFLESNLAKYKSNQTLIDAIDEAINLYDSGVLDKKEETSTTGSSIVTLYESAPKNIKPLDEEGRYTIYKVTITYNQSMRMPVRVNVMNCFAPVDKTDGNKIVMTEAVNKQEIDINLTEEEWYTMIDTMKAQKIMFENMTYPEQVKLAEKISIKNMKETTA